MAQPHPLILASASPRRRALLGLLGLPFEVRVSGIDEAPREAETPLAYVQRVAQEKARSVAAAEAGAPGLIISADTEVVFDGRIFGKPADAADAAQMLARLRGQTHEVISAITVLDTASGQARDDVCSGPVPMRAYADEEVQAYVASGDPLDKAGAYAIQHAGFHPVEGFQHCYASVVGLPLCHLTRTLRAFGLQPAADVPRACQDFLQYSCPIYDEILRPA